MWKVPRRRWISHTYPTWLWGHSLFKISSAGPVLYETKQLLWRTHKESPTFHSECRINKKLIKRGSTIDHWKSRCKGRISWSTPYTCMHTYIHRGPQVEKRCVIIFHSRNVTHKETFEKGTTYLKPRQHIGCWWSTGEGGGREGWRKKKGKGDDR
jgi:hypothetical protein